MLIRRFFSVKQTFVGRSYSTKIPFDAKAFPFSRFEPCCPDTSVQAAENGFVPCQNHPMPAVLGKKIDMVDSMQRPASLRHIVGCVGHDAIEWTRAKVEAVPDGAVQTLLTAENEWLRHNRSLHDSSNVLITVADRPSVDPQAPDLLFFPEFKMLKHVNAITQGSPIYTVMDSIWRDPHQPLDEISELEEIKADTVVLVCTHGRRDLRCGKLGPLIVEEFKHWIEKAGYNDKVEVWGTSHFGGHKFAGNLIIHQRGLGGHMYGNVRQCHVKDIVDRHIIHSKVIKEIWRGQVTPPLVQYK